MFKSCIDMTSLNNNQLHRRLDGPIAGLEVLEKTSCLNILHSKYHVIQY